MLKKQRRKALEEEAETRLEATKSVSQGMRLTLERGNRPSSFRNKFKEGTA